MRATSEVSRGVSGSGHNILAGRVHNYYYYYYYDTMSVVVVSRVVAIVFRVCTKHVESDLPIDDVARTPFVKLKLPFFFGFRDVV